MTQLETATGKLPRWSMVLGLLAVALPVLGALGTRFGLWSFGIGLLLVPASLIPATLGLIFGLLGVWRLRKAGQAPATAALGAAISLLAGVYLGLGVLSAFSVPPIHNVSTDIEDPPQFTAAYELRGEEENPLEYDSEVIGPLQREGYPELGPLVLPIPAEQMYQRVLTALGGMGLEIVREDPERGEVEAVATTRWFGFKDDVVLRVRETGDGARLDIRSVSRVGVVDLGANAERILEIISRVETSS